jgi:hypothetical protein
MLLESTVTPLTTLPTAHPSSEAILIRTAPPRFVRPAVTPVYAPRA